MISFGARWYDSPVLLGIRERTGQDCAQLLFHSRNGSPKAIRISRRGWVSSDSSPSDRVHQRNESQADHTEILTVYILM